MEFNLYDIQNNVFDFKKIISRLKEDIPDTLYVRKVITNFEKNKDGSITDQVNSFTYECIELDKETYVNLKIKLKSSYSVVSQEMIDASEHKRIRILLPVKEVDITAYKAYFNELSLSISVPRVTLMEKDNPLLE